MIPIDSSPVVKPKDQTVVDHAERILKVHPELQETTEKVRDRIRKIIQIVFGKNELLYSRFKGADIRWTAMCGEVANEVLHMLGESSDHIQLLSIGDVNLPDFAREAADQIMESAHLYHKGLIEDEGYGYDLAAKGSARARDSMMKCFDEHYDFSCVPGLIEKLILNSTIVGGGMRGLDDIATSMVSIAEAEDKKHRFIQPDNSFGTWKTIVALRSGNGKTAEVHQISTDQKNLLHLTPKLVDEFYAEHPVGEEYNDSWCITPVGNPSGTYIDADALTETCKRIVRCNPNATIILDSTYVRTLKPEIAKHLVAGIINDPDVLNRILFTESFSKTHGFSGERLGAYFSANEEIYNGVQTINMTLSAGNGRQKSALVLALTNPTQEQKDRIEKLHEFWARERHGLYNYLVNSGQYGHLFDDNQSHILPEQLENPLGLYVLIKIKPGVDRNTVLEETGCLGVETKMGSGDYIRFSVGKIKTATYAKYATLSDR